MKYPHEVLPRLGWKEREGQGRGEKGRGGERRERKGRKKERERQGDKSREKEPVESRQHEATDTEKRARTRHPRVPAIIQWPAEHRLSPCSRQAPHSDSSLCFI